MEAGSSLAIVLVLGALFLTLGSIKWCSHKLKRKEIIMNKQDEKTIRTVKHCMILLTNPLAHLLDTFWAFGASVMAMMATPLLIH